MDCTSGQDFIVSELLSELKAENERKDHKINRLNKTLTITLIAAMLAVLLVVAGFLWYLNQYDYTSTTTETITAEGVYTIMDSNGNVIGSDFTAEEIQSFLEGVTTDGEVNEN
jgi:hypothetical protein